MGHFKVMLRGENFRLTLEEKPTLLGFYATRVVEAKDREAAELLAVDFIRRDKQLQGVLNRRDDPPMIFAEEIEPIAEADIEGIVTSGFTFFLAESSAEHDA